MNPRERVLAALRRQVPDRIPYFIRCTPPVVAQLQERTGETDPAVYFDTDVRDAVIDPPVAEADYGAYLAGKPAGTQVTEEGIGQVQGTFEHYTRNVPLLDQAKTVRDIESFPIPDIGDPNRFATYGSRVAALQAAGYAVRGRIGSLFEWAWQVRGFEQLFLDFAQRPELAERLLDRKTEILCRAARLQLAAGIDVLGINDDIAMQTGPMMSPATWRRWFKPRWARVLAAARDARPDVLVWYHSDGNATAFVPELIEIGVNILNPIQPECMDGAAVKRQFGDRLAFWGGLGTQSVLPFGTPDDVRREVRRLAATLGENGGLLLEPTHQVQPDVPWENILAYIDEARQTWYA